MGSGGPGQAAELRGVATAPHGPGQGRQPLLRQRFLLEIVQGRQLGEEPVGQARAGAQDRVADPAVFAVGPGDLHQCRENPPVADLSQSQSHPHSHPGILVPGHFQDLPQEPWGALHPELRVRHGVLPDPRRGIGQRLCYVRVSEGAQPVQRPEGVHPGQGMLAIVQQPPQQRHRGLVLALEDEPMRGLPPPAAGVLQVSDQLLDACFAQARRRWNLEIEGRHPVDPPVFRPAGEIQVRQDPLHHVAVLHEFPAHVQHVEGPVGGVDRVDGTEPVVAGTKGIPCPRARPARF